MTIIPLIEELVAQELANASPDLVKIYFDQDGVLADFDGGVDTSASARASRDVYREALMQFPEFLSLSDDEVKKRLAGPQTEPRMKALKKAWSHYRDQKFAMTGRAGFFLNLPVLPGAREMLSQAAAWTGRKPAILTAPVDAYPDRCASEKEQWMNNHFHGMYSSFHCTQEKAKFATIDSVLIDDRQKYTVPWEQRGGIAILHTDPKDSMEKLRRILKTKGLPV